MREEVNVLDIKTKVLKAECEKSTRDAFDSSPGDLLHKPTEAEQMVVKTPSHLFTGH